MGDGTESLFRQRHSAFQDANPDPDPMPNQTDRTWFEKHRSIMHTVNIHEAKTHLSRLVDQAAQGEAFVIAKAGKPMVRVVPLDAPAPNQARRLGFLAGQFNVPADFDRMGSEAIEQLSHAQP